MFKSLRGLAVPSEKKLRTELIRELAQLEELVSDTENGESIDELSGELSVHTLPSGRRVYCPNRQYPTRNRKHHVRSLLVH